MAVSLMLVARSCKWELIVVVLGSGAYEIWKLNFIFSECSTSSTQGEPAESSQSKPTLNSPNLSQRVICNVSMFSAAQIHDTFHIIRRNVNPRRKTAVQISLLSHWKTTMLDPVCNCFTESRCLLQSRIEFRTFGPNSA